jgi:hypothetical protein
VTSYVPALANLNPFFAILETLWHNRTMNEGTMTEIPTRCPTCQSDLLATRLACPACHTEVTGNFTLSRLASLPEPYASLLEMFLRARGNMKEMERELGLSYPTVRARLEEALQAAGFSRANRDDGVDLHARRRQVLDRLQSSDITAAEAAQQLRDLKRGRVQ